MKHPSVHDLAKFGVFVAAFGVASGTLSCGDDSVTGDDGPKTVEGVDLDAVIYEGGATDEALVALLAADPETDESQAALLDAPDSPVTASAPVEFAWHVGTSSARWSPSVPRGPVDQPFMGALAAQSHEAWNEVVAGLLIKPAYAHGAPVNGRAYLLTFTDADDAAVAHVFTTELTYTPSVEVYASLREAPQPITVEILNAVFDTNRIPSDGGPFAGGAASLSFE